jgi:hypothetical protein
VLERYDRQWMQGEQAVDESEKIAISAAVQAEYKSRDRIEEAAHKSLERLYDYTKFHIGVYISLTTAYVAFASAKVGEQPLVHVKFGFLLFAVLFFMLAGAAGGTVLCSITQTSAVTSRDFLREEISPWNKPFKMAAIKWTWLEHALFWIAVICAVLSLT